ncbi:S8 family serine peptidase [Occultella glacieicola]|uniref:S8 family serine peptidase n=1 Tax=Occultella glacieicola TaxID=2518684 RepID=UPI0014045DAA|nr:S8 family serine peptidase [Occultella glacieicola]
MSKTRSRLVALLATAALALGFAPAASAHVPTERTDPPDADTSSLESADVSGSTSLARDRGTVLRLGTAATAELYIVQLEAPTVSAYEGGIHALQATRPDAGERLDPSSAPVQDYRSYLADEQGELTQAIEAEIGRTPDVSFSYTYALNGIALELTTDEAAAVARLSGVTSVVVDVERQLQTDNGPAWIGAPSIWDGSATGVAGTRGEGIVAGVLDTGVNPSNPSFADSVPASAGGDGYDHTNPRPGFVGMCDPANTEQYDPRFVCNDKLIGAWDFVGDGPFDTDGHGSHTASTVAGNQVDAVVEGPSGISETRRIQGVAPHANLITYDVCTTGCSTAAITAAIDQAIDDGVDVINYSIGSDTPSSVWADPDTLGFLNARAAGVFVATSAGNDGPGAATLGSPADAPWLTSVANSTHDRRYVNAATGLNRTDGVPHPDISGLGFTVGYGPAPVVYAGDHGNPLCLAGIFPEGTFDGQIVVCDRGENGRVEKGQVVLAAGAGGMVLANDEASGSSLTGDAHVLPAVHITYADGVSLKTWLAEGDGHVGSIAGASLDIRPENGDVTSASSSRGPNRAIDLVSPSVTAPGTDILAAYGASTVEAEVAPTWNFVSGTSMASPHVAGAGALLSALEPTWTPAEIQSALMTTASTANVTKEDGTTPADPFDMGSGRVDLQAAANAGLLLDETIADYLAADPGLGGDPRSLNVASMADGQCLQTCSWTRTVTGSADGSLAWTAAAAAAEGMSLTVEPSTFTLAEGQTQEITVTADVSGAEAGTWLFGEVTLTPSTEGVPTAALPVAVLPSTGVLPDEVVIDTRRDAGSTLAEGLESIEISDLHAEVAGLTPSVATEYSVPQDPTNPDPYDNATGTVVLTFDVPEGAARFVTDVTASTATDIDLFVGQGTTPSAATEVCASTTAGAIERCDVGAPEAGTWWVVLQNWEASAPDATDTVTLGVAVVAGDAGNLSVEGPTSNPGGTPFDLRVFYDEPALEEGQRWFGAISLGSSPGSPGDIGILPVTLNRFADDVTKTADVEVASPGDTVTYTLTVEPNVTDTDLEYTLTDTIPAGLTYVEGSATGGATVTDGVLSWQGTLPTAVGAEGTYAVTSSGENPTCANPFDGGGYVDLASLGNFATNPGISGDTAAFTVSSTVAPFSFYGIAYDAISLTDDGFVIFDGASNYGGSPWAPQAVPDAALPNNLLAMLWQDMEIVYDQATNKGVTLVNLGGTGAGSLLVIEYDDVQLYGDPDSTYDVEIFALRGQDDTAGQYEFYVAYDNVTGSVAGPLTIGAENVPGTSGQALVNNASGAGVVANDTVVCFDYQGPTFDPVTITYQATVDDSGLGNGDVLTNEVTHVTDNPGAQPVTTGVGVTVEGVYEIPVVTIEGTRNAQEPRTDGQFTFTRTGDLSEPLTVRYRAEPTWRAIPGIDYVRLDGMVTFAAGAATATETVDVIDRWLPIIYRRTLTLTVLDRDAYDVGDPGSASIDIKTDWRWPWQHGVPKPV